MLEEFTLHVLVFFVPASHVESVKEAVFAVGAGRLGNYEACSWQSLGTGQFRPLPGSTPFVGSKSELEQVPEYRVEMTCDDDLVELALEALRVAHPYEETPCYCWPVS